VSSRAPACDYAGLLREITLGAKLQAIRNVSSSWVSLGVNLAVGVFLTPFILHRLGDEGYGLWILVFSVTGFYRMFNLGIGSAVIRYVARFIATRDFQSLERYLNTILFLYSSIAILLFATTLLISWHLESLFHISPSFHTTARFLFLLVGSGLALQFPMGVFGGILEGLQQFWWKNIIQIGSDLLRALLIFLALRQGFGLLTISFITVAVSLLSSAFYIPMVRKYLPITVRILRFDRAVFVEIIRYASVTFTSMVGSQLRYKSDAVVIGMFLTASSITPFAIATKFIDYSTATVDCLAQIFTPMSSHLHAKGDMESLRRVFVRGNRICALLIFPLCVGLIILGKSAIEVWVGAKYVSSYWILLTLLVPHTLEKAQWTSPRILYGMAQHWTLGKVRLLEGVANLALSIILLRYYGILGVALGTAIPLMISSTLFLPQHLCGILHVRLGTFIKEAYLPPLLLCLPLVLVLYPLQHHFPAHTLLQLLKEAVAGGLVYGIGVCWYVFVKEPAGIQLRARFLQYLAADRRP
jgi:O-antigen/teichoic acid export membrane protein